MLGLIYWAEMGGTHILAGVVSAMCSLGSGIDLTPSRPPPQTTKDELRSAVDWLLNEAVLLEYSDHSGPLNAEAAAMPSPSLAAFDYGAATMLSFTAEMATKLQVPQGEVRATSSDSASSLDDTLKLPGG